MPDPAVETVTLVLYWVGCEADELRVLTSGFWDEEQSEDEPDGVFLAEERLLGVGRQWSSPGAFQLIRILRVTVRLPEVDAEHYAVRSRGWTTGVHVFPAVVLNALFPSVEAVTDEEVMKMYAARGDEWAEQIQRDYDIERGA